MRATQLLVFNQSEGAALLNYWWLQMMSILLFFIIPTSVSIGQVKQAKSQLVSSFILVNASDEQDIGELSDRDTIDLATLRSRLLNIRANIGQHKGVEVVFTLGGQQSYKRKELGYPFSLFGDNNGNYSAWTPAPGNYTLTATPYFDTGKKGMSLTISFTVINTLSISSFTLVNAIDEQDIRELSDRDTINLADLPNHSLSVRANASLTSGIEVIFELEGTKSYTRRELGQPYSLFGDEGGNYHAWTPAPGNYTLTATPYFDGLKGLKGNSLTVHFTVVSSQEEDEEEDSPGVLTLKSANDSTFNSSKAELVFTLEGASFLNDPTRQHLYVDNQEIPLTSISIKPNEIVIPFAWKDGLNEIEFLGTDTNELPISGSYSLWAGNNSLPVTVVDPDGNPVEGTSVEVTLSDNTDVKAFGTTNANGLVTFNNIPMRTLVITAKTNSNLFGTAGIVGFGYPVTIVLKGFDEPSSIDNNDFSQGLEGWNIGTEPVQLIPHVELEASELIDKQKAIMADENLDLQLSTSGIGPKFINRTFRVEQVGNQGVVVRFRFVTTEIPGGYYGSQYNDYYSIAVRNQKTGAVTSESKAMNSFAFSEFDVNGGTTWREIAVSAAPGDVVRVDVEVANVADGLLDSHIIVDYVSAEHMEIKSVKLTDIDNTALNYLSLDDHNYFNGFTRVNGSLVIEGSSEAKLSKVELEILQNKGLIAVGMLNPDFANEVLTTFGNDETISIANASALFLIPAKNMNMGPGSVQLRVAAELESGIKKTYDVKTVKIFTKFDFNNRYSGRDPLSGGDDWGEPSVVDFIDNSLPKDWFLNDLSTMNGGQFPSHDSHKHGTDLDLRFSQARPNPVRMNTAEIANKLLNILQGSAGSRIQKVLVTFDKNDKDPFWNVIKDKPGSSKIKKYEGHTDHVHLSIIPSTVSPQFLDNQPIFAIVPPRNRANLTKNQVQNHKVMSLKKERVQDFMVYPNPADIETLQLNILGLLPESNGSVLRIYDTSGRVVYETVISNISQSEPLKVRLDAAKIINKGLYFMAIQGEGVNVSRKIIVK